MADEPVTDAVANSLKRARQAAAASGQPHGAPQAGSSKPEPEAQAPQPAGDVTQQGPLVSEQARVSGSRRGRRIATMAGILVLGLLLGVGGVVVVDRVWNDDPSKADCEAARSLVDGSVKNMEELSTAEEQDKSFFAAMIVEQRTITYAMDAEPKCFSLQERAGAEGLLDGIRGLLTSAPG